MSKKLIFKLLSPYSGLTYDIKRNFTHLVSETRPRHRARAVFKFYKTQIRSKNHEIWQNDM